MGGGNVAGALQNLVKGVASPETRLLQSIMDAKSLHTPRSSERRALGRGHRAGRLRTSG